MTTTPHPQAEAQSLLAAFSLPIRVSHSDHAPALWHIEDQLGKPVATVHDKAQASLISFALNALVPAQVADNKMPLPIALRLLASQIKANDGLRDNRGLHHRMLEEAAAALSRPAQVAESAGAVHACMWALDSGGRPYRRYSEPQCTPSPATGAADGGMAGATPALDEIEAAARACTALNFDSAELKREGGEIECPHCGGEGYVEQEADYCNFDGAAIGVQFYGVGLSHGAAERFLRAVNPAVALRLVALARHGISALATPPTTPQAMPAVKCGQCGNTEVFFYARGDELKTAATTGATPQAAQAVCYPKAEKMENNGAQGAPEGREGLSDERIEAIAHRRAWRYKHSSDPNHRSTYTFNLDCLLEFARDLLSEPTQSVLKDSLTTGTAPGRGA